MSDPINGGNGAPDGFARAGQAPVPAQPWGAYPAPADGTQPYPVMGGATATGGRRRASSRSRLMAGVGSLVAVAVLVAAAGLLSGRSATTSSSVPQGATTPAASAPAVPGGTQPGNTTAPQSGTSTGVGTQSSTGQVAATAAQTKGVVLINTTVAGGSAAGTGMVIDSSGLVLTNYHVVQGSTKVEVTIAATDKTYTATVVGHDAVNDVALLRLAGASALETVAIDRDAVTVGTKVVAVGNANGQDFLTGAAGTITDTAATVTVRNDSAAGSETLTDVYETNAQAQPGDSGGPLFDTQNEVTGMTTAGEQTFRGPRTGTATTVTSYAIPIARALSIVKQIETGTSAGTVRVGPNAYLGIMVSTAQTGSAIVSSVTSGTPAAKAGITAGSAITKIGGTTVSTQAQIAAALAGRSPGQTIKVGWTDASGQTHSADVVLAASPVN